MAEESNNEEKTEAPSDKKRQEARNKGSVAKSSEVNSVLVLLAGLACLKIFGSWMVREMIVFVNDSIMMISHPQMDLASLAAFFASAALATFKISMPVVAGILLFGVASNIIQVGFLFSLEPLTPKLEKVNPISGFGRLFSRQALVELVKSIFKMVVIGLVAYLVIKKHFVQLLLLADSSVAVLWRTMLSVAFDLMFWMCIVLIVLAVLDYWYQRFEYERKLKMTKQEVKEERKQMEGDPLIKSRVRSLQREMARRRMMKEVPKATVVVTNPTYIAIALRYEPERMQAPLVVAKGKRLMADRIREIAIENGIPIVEDKPLARAMYDKINPGDQIPMEFFTAVAEILAYVYRLKQRNAA